ncbi:AP-3 complex subunit delta-1 [Hypsibius exemplaris]|uniref:AP-3 complex subunit delta n=1 Tax=Hypsibius exemplaris TaxID=2072580 RepID=A0A1W0X0U0_HYPEX|nr:AP-3 complex subunit delta-1 [Hypsibius exemplaris]
MALRKVKGNIERLFDKSLTDLVRGIRNNRDNEARYIAQCMDEIKLELKQDNIAVKTNAIEKLAYLQMLGYDISWAAFNIIEVMSSTKFTCKRVGYLAAAQTFSDETDVLMLTTNMIRKDITSSNLYDASIALGGLACFISNDLARDLANDAMSLMTSSKAYVRKRAVLLMYKVFLRYPDALRPCFARLKEKLEDPDPGVQSAAVNVICELARKHPKNYLALAPTFFKLMTNSSNNWMLIKIIKLFGALTPLEPRLGKKLIEPLTTLIHSTSAMSLLYECINTVIAVLLSVASGLPDHTASIQLCVQKLRILIEDSDQNLKYLGLLAMSKILQAHPKSVLSLKDLILQCLDDRDESIRLRALDLLYGMVNKKTLMDIVKKLMDHMEKAEGSGYRDELLTKIIFICSQNNFQHVVDFEWYVSVLVDLTKMEGTHHGEQIAAQLLDVAVRVSSIRHFTVQQMAILLENAHKLPLSAHGSTLHEVLLSAAWICGEFSEHLIDPRDTMEAMLRSKVTSFPPHIQAVFVQNIGKLCSKVMVKAEAEEEGETIRAVGRVLVDRLGMFVNSSELEVQERASALLQIIQLVLKHQEDGGKVAGALQAFYAGELNPVAPQAQKKVPVPDGLDLDAWINEPVAEKKETSEEESDEEDDRRVQSPVLFTKSARTKGFTHEENSEGRTTPSRPELSEKELQDIRNQRLVEQASNPYYIKPSSKGSRRTSSNVFSSPDTPKDVSDDVNGIAGLTSSERYLRQQKKDKPSVKKDKKKSKKDKKDSDDEGGVTTHVVNRDLGEMPEGATFSDDAHSDENDPYKSLNIDVQSPLRIDERLPVSAHRQVTSQRAVDPVVEEKTTKKKKHREDGEKKSRKSKAKTEEDALEKTGKKKKDGTSKKSSKKAAQEVSLISMAEEPDSAGTTVVVQEEHPQTPHVVEDRNTTGTDDLSFWLTQDNQPKEKAADRPNTLEVKRPTSSAEKKAAKESKEKKKKKSRSKLRSHSAEEELVDDVPEIVDKTGYEEAFSMELEAISGNGSPAVEEAPLSRFTLLTEDKNVKLEYDTYISDASRQQIAVNVVFTNKLTDGTLKNIAFEVVDSVGLVVDQSSGIEIPVKFAQMPPKSNWNMTLELTLKANSASPQTVRGTVTYMKVDTAGGSSGQEMRDFRLRLPGSAFLLPVQVSVDEFAMVLESGQLSQSADAQLELPGATKFSDVLTRICFRGRFFLVEHIGNSATLHAMSILQQRAVVMVKLLPGTPNRLSLVAKSTDPALTGPLLEEIVASVRG